MRNNYNVWEWYKSQRKCYNDKWCKTMQWVQGFIKDLRHFRKTRADRQKQRAISTHNLLIYLKRFDWFIYIKRFHLAGHHPKIAKVTKFYFKSLLTWKATIILLPMPWLAHFTFNIIDWLLQLFIFVPTFGTSMHLE